MERNGKKKRLRKLKSPDTTADNAQDTSMHYCGHGRGKDVKAAIT